jgi:hypothetical protein
MWEKALAAKKPTRLRQHRLVIIIKHHVFSLLNGTVKWYSTYGMLLTNMFGGKYRKGQWQAAAIVDATDSLDKHS